MRALLWWCAAEEGPAIYSWEPDVAGVSPADELLDRVWKKHSDDIRSAIDMQGFWIGFVDGGATIVVDLGRLRREGLALVVTDIGKMGRAIPDGWPVALDTPA